MNHTTLLYPPIVKPTCEHEITGVESRELRTYQGKDFICGKLSTIKIDEKTYCKSHAGAVARKILLLRNTPKKYPRYLVGCTALEILLSETNKEAKQ